MVDYDALAYVENSQYRVTTVQALLEKPQIPSEIAKDSSHDMAHVSRAITELADKGITELLVSEDTKKGRLYGLTENGEEIAEVVKQRANDE
jgi:DNA-binding MarR family transcriptional regulator